MIIKYLAVVFFILLFLIIAFEILKDLTKERKLIDGKRKPKQNNNGYNYANSGYNHVYGEKVVPLEKRNKHIKKHSRRDK